MAPIAPLIKTLTARVLQLSEQLLSQLGEALAHSGVTMFAFLQVNHGLVQLDNFVAPDLGLEILELGTFALLYYWQSYLGVFREEFERLEDQLIVDIFEFLLAES